MIGGWVILVSEDILTHIYTVTCVNYCMLDDS